VYIEKINTPEDIKKYNINELEVLAQEFKCGRYPVSLSEPMSNSICTLSLNFSNIFSANNKMHHGK